MIEDKEGLTWGCAYRVTGDAALQYLKNRECTLGGYVTIDTKFFPRIAFEDSDGVNGEAFEVTVYIATDKNEHWLGDEQCVHHIANQIVESRGPSGHNVEYLLRLANFMRNEIPGADDDHLFTLEQLVSEKLKVKNIPLEDVMGENPRRIRRDSHELHRQPTTFEFASRVPETRLRCLNL